MAHSDRMLAAAKAAGLHFLGSLLVAAFAAALVFLVWYPYPYGALSGGRTLFLILVGVDVVCGPLLTMVLFNPLKPRHELLLDLSLILFIQLAALGYGLHTAYLARPLYLVHEVDRFRVITRFDYGDVDVDVDDALAKLPKNLRVDWLEGPMTVGIRDPHDAKERQDVLFESVFGGRDYSQRPEFYVPYDLSYQGKALDRSKPLSRFLAHVPEVSDDAGTLLRKSGVSVEEARYLPVLHKQEWVAVLNQSAQVLGFLPGDGFGVP